MAVLIAGGVAGCSSQPPTAPQQPGALPGGEATVWIDGRDASVDGSVQCQTIGSLTTVQTGNQDVGFTAVISSGSGLVAESIGLRDLAGFTGSYNSGLGDEAEVSMVGRTYQIRGSADGFATDNPSFRSAAKFSIEASC